MGKLFFLFILIVTITCAYAQNPENVQVDQSSNIVLLYWDAPEAEVLIEDDFESYQVDEYLAEQSDLWTTWNDDPGSTEDAYVTDALALSGTNSVLVENESDLVLIMDTFSSGYHSLEFDLYVPNSNDACFYVYKTNRLQELGLDATIDIEGMLIYAGTTDWYLYWGNYLDQWIHFEIIADLDNDIGKLMYNGYLYHYWRWSLNSVGFPGLQSLGGLEFTTDGNGPFYCDDVKLTSNYVNGYNIYLDGEFQGFTRYLGYQLLNLEEGNSYTAGVSAVYDTGESDIVEVTFTNSSISQINAPNNLSVEETTGIFSWNTPDIGDQIELSQHDGTPESGFYQQIGNIYGVVYDLSSYTNVTLEMLDFRHSPWGYWGIWDYSVYVVDWDTYTELEQTEVLQTTGDDQWEEGIELGSIPESGLVGVFIKPLDYDDNIDDVYPCIDTDANTDGASYYGSLYDFTSLTQSTNGDFLMDLWITANETEGVVQAPRLENKFSDPMEHKEGTIPPVDFTTTDQTIRELQSYNVYLDDILQGNTADTLWQFTDLVYNQTYSAGVEAIYNYGVSDQVTIDFTCNFVDADDDLPLITELHGNYPNPFNPSTTIKFNMRKAGFVSLEIYNIKGQKVRTLINQQQEAGQYSKVWNGTDDTGNPVGSGIYFYRLKVDGTEYPMRKCLLLK